MPVAPVEIEPLRETPKLETPKAAPAPPPETVVELPKPPEPVTPEPPPPPKTPDVAPPVAPKRPAVKVGDFAAATPTATPKADPRQVQTVGFDVQQAVAPDIKARVAEVGAFEAREAKDPRAGSDRPSAVAATGFESAQALTPGPRAGRAVASTGFGATTAAPRAQAPREAVKSVGFADAQPSPAAAAPQQKVAQAVTPVEVLFKPTPAYSNEARAMKIEGEVTLEVEFSASGQVRVVRVVRGLGHGLDELAVKAAEQIRFKPAQSSGRPVDFTANVQIVFRLT
jgi:TonB family protein